MTSQDNSLSPDKISYLAFQGGGGKGMTYVGAIAALQRVINGPPGSTLPLISPWKSGNRIKGISGASAGAITALFLCLGYTANQLSDLLNAMDFTTFFDDPNVGSHLHFVDDNGLVSIRVQKDGKTNADISRLISAFSDAVMKKTRQDMLQQKASTSSPASPLESILVAHLDSYVASLYFDFGFFIGFPAVDFFARKIGEFIEKNGGSTKIKATGYTLTFSQLVKLTNGVRLVLTGTNIWTQRTHYFSDLDTPDFPVAAACLISMSIPPAFKPIVLECPVDRKDGAKSDLYRGIWLDGGILNNFPIHAFDDPSTSTLNPNILGLRLVDGFPKNRPAPVESPDLSKLGITDYASMLMQTLLYPSSEGQIRSAAEATQTVSLYAQKLTTMDFSPSPDDVKSAQSDAGMSVYSYFGQ